MKKEFINKQLGKDGRFILGTTDGVLAMELSFVIGEDHEVAKLSASYSAIKILQPAVKILKDVIPGEKFDGYVDDVAELALKYFGVGKQALKAEQE